MGNTTINNADNPFSIWYSIAIVCAYGLLLSDYVNAINAIVIDESLGRVYDFFIKYGFLLYILSSIAVWIAMSLILHLSSLLFDGNRKFGQFLKVSAFPWLVYIVAIIVGRVVIMNIPDSVNDVSGLLTDKNYILATKMINYATLPFFLAYIIQVHSFYHLRWWKAILVVILPFGTISSLSELFKIV